MTKKELREQLLAQITPEEWEHLRAGDNCLRVSDFNRRTVMRLEEEVQGDSDAPVDSDSAAELANALQAYLGQYMAESPEAAQVDHPRLPFLCIHCRRAAASCRSCACCTTRGKRGNTLVLHRPGRYTGQPV